MGFIGQKWTKFKTSKHYHNVMVFMGFVCLSFSFWLIMTLNDNAQNDFDVRLNIENVPNNVTFLENVPVYIHVNVRDKGSSLWQSGILKKPEIKFKFSQFANDGMLKLTKADISAAMRSVFGSTAVINISTDSLNIPYTTAPGKQVRLIIDADVSPSFRSAINAKPYAIGGNMVTIYGYQTQLDTITYVRTRKIVCHDLSETKVVKAKVKQISGVKIEPDIVEVQIPVEPLVLKRALVNIKPINVPNGKTLMLFPSKIEVTYFAPMSQYEKVSEDIIVVSDYNEILKKTNVSRISLQLNSYPDKYINTKLTQDSVEYTIVTRQ